MRNGVDSVMGNAITEEPKETNNNQQGQDSLALLFAMSKSPRLVTKKHRPMRRYNVIRHKDGVTYVMTNISQIRAARLKAKFHKEGFTVDLLELSSLSGIVIPSEAPIGNIPCPIPYQTNRQKVRDQEIANKLASWRANRISQKNARLGRAKEGSKVYDKVSGMLVFSGSVENAVDFVIKRMENGIWNIGDWVIYLPSKIWEKLGGTVNG